MSYTYFRIPTETMKDIKKEYEHDKTIQGYTYLGDEGEFIFISGFGDETLFDPISLEDIAKEVHQQQVLLLMSRKEFLMEMRDNPSDENTLDYFMARLDEVMILLDIYGVQEL